MREVGRVWACSSGRGACVRVESSREKTTDGEKTTKSSLEDDGAGRGGAWVKKGFVCGVSAAAALVVVFA